MAYTKHGYQIMDTPKEGEPPEAIVKCGGPGPCRECNTDSTMARIKNFNPRKEN